MFSLIFFVPLSTTRFSFFFFNDTATTEIYTLSLHDALPIYGRLDAEALGHSESARELPGYDPELVWRSEEHTSELQSRPHLVCRLLLEKKTKHASLSSVVARVGSAGRGWLRRQ